MSKNSEKKFAREVLLKSKEFSDVQPDFLGAILKDDFYTLADAHAAVDRFFGKVSAAKTEQEAPSDAKESRKEVQ